MVAVVAAGASAAAAADAAAATAASAAAAAAAILCVVVVVIACSFAAGTAFDTRKSDESTCFAVIDRHSCGRSSDDCRFVASWIQRRELYYLYDCRIEKRCCNRGRGRCGKCR